LDGEKRNTGMLGNRDNGKLECWNNGMMGNRDNGKLECWEMGIVEYWEMRIPGIMEYWNGGVATCLILK
jgi:hypothetical protein